MPRNKDAGEGRVPSSPSGAASFFTCPGWSGHPDALLKSVHQGRCLCLCLLQDSDEWRDRLSGGKRHVSTHIRRSSKGTAMASQDSALTGLFLPVHKHQTSHASIHIIQGSSSNAGLGWGQRTFLTRSQMMAMPLVHRPHLE